MRRAVVAACLVLLGPAARGDAADLEAYRGTYAVAGRVLLVHAPRDGALAYIEDGRSVRLEPAGRDVFRSSLGETVTFRRDPRGRPTGLSVAVPGRRTVHGVRVHVYAERPLEAGNGAVRLSGAALLPPGRGRRPGAVIVGGTARATRESALALAHALARRGVAAAVYDARAAHAPGPAPAVPLADLAGDALAIRAALAALPEVDRARVGLVGVGRASLLLPLAAVREPAVAFVVSVSGSGLSLADTDLYARRRRMERAGLPARAVETAVTGVRLLHDLGRLASRGLLPVRGHVADDPDGSGATAWAEVRSPVLLVYGGRDGEVPAEASAIRIAAVLAGARHPDATLRLFPEADHDLQVTDAGGRRPAPGYLDLLAGWIREGSSRQAPEGGALAVRLAPAPARPRPGLALLPAGLAALAAVVLAVAGATVSRRGARAPSWLLLAAVAALDAALVGSIGWLLARLGRGDDGAAALVVPVLDGLTLAFVGSAGLFAAAVAATWRRTDGGTRAWLAVGVVAALAVVPVLVQFGLVGR